MLTQAVRFLFQVINGPEIRNKFDAKFRSTHKVY
jgi:hypothetical protein